jgi:hypothetical protein
MTEDELVLFFALGLIGVSFGGAWGAFSTLRWNNLFLTILPAAAIPIFVTQTFFIFWGGIRAVILFPGLVIAIGAPATVSALVIHYIRKKQTNQNKAN